MAEIYVLRGGMKRRRTRARMLYFQTFQALDCIIYRKRKDGAGYSYYCLEARGDGCVNANSFKFSSCTPSGKPLTPLPFPIRQLPTPPGTSPLTKRVSKWITLMNNYDIS